MRDLDTQFLNINGDQQPMVPYNTHETEEIPDNMMIPYDAQVIDKDLNNRMINDDIIVHNEKHIHQTYN